MSHLNDLEKALNIVTFIDKHETPYRGFNLIMYETEHDVYRVNITDPNGKIIHRMADIPHWEEAEMWAMGVVDGYLIYLEHLA